MHDKHRRPIKPLDVLKMYHFTSVRRKKYYMYKWVYEKDGHLYAYHLDKTQGSFRLFQELLHDTEIVQGYGEDGKTFEDREKV